MLPKRRPWRRAVQANRVGPDLERPFACGLPHASWPRAAGQPGRWRGGGDFMGGRLRNARCRLGGGRAGPGPGRALGEARGPGSEARPPLTHRPVFRIDLPDLTAVTLAASSAPVNHITAAAAAPVQDRRRPVLPGHSGIQAGRRAARLLSLRQCPNRLRNRALPPQTRPRDRATPQAGSRQHRPAAPRPFLSPKRTGVRGREVFT